MEKKVIVKVEDVSIKFSLASEKFDGFKEYFIQRVKKKKQKSRNKAVKSIDRMFVFRYTNLVLFQ